MILKECASTRQPRSRNKAQQRIQFKKKDRKGSVEEWKRRLQHFFFTKKKSSLFLQFLPESF